MKNSDSEKHPCPLFREECEEPVVMPIEDVLDLHTFNPREVRDLLDDYLEAARKKGFVEVRIIHGKGSGVLKQSVGNILRNHPLVLSIKDADSMGGGWGATIVKLRTGPKEES